MSLSRRAFLAAGATAAVPAASNKQTAASEGGNVAPVLIDAKFESVTDHGFMSDAIHLGEQAGFTVTPIYQSKLVNGAYQRPPHNATVGGFEVKIKSLEGGEYAASAPCGMSIIAQTFMTFLRTGDRIVTHRCVYDNTMRLMSEYLPRLGIDVNFVDMNDMAAVRRALSEKKASMVFFEPYVNPTCEVLDAPAIIEAAKKAGVMCVVDNTWLSPYLFQPLRHGADLVLHSATKYIGGHGSAMGGVISGSRALVAQIEQTIGVTGGILRPHDAFLLTQGVKTLGLRMKEHTTSALKVAEFLQSHPMVARVRYGGLPSWKGHEIAKDWLRGFGGMMGVEWKDDTTHNRFGSRLKLCKPWVSLGDVVTLVSQRNAEPGRAIPKRFTRISIGLEEPEDIITDFKQALS